MWKKHKQINIMDLDLADRDEVEWEIVIIIICTNV